MCSTACNLSPVGYAKRTLLITLGVPVMPNFRRDYVHGGSLLHCGDGTTRPDSLYGLIPAFSYARPFANTVNSSRFGLMR